MYLLDFVMLFLAAGALVNAWMMKDGLFEGWRDSLSAWGEPVHEEPNFGDKWRWFWSKLLTCRVCLTYHASFWLTVLFWLPGLLWLWPPWDVVLFIPVYALAATRLSLLIGSAVTALGIEGDPEVDA
jgi:hypothetical protein